jgi:hypothetical protein
LGDPGRDRAFRRVPLQSARGARDYDGETILTRRELSKTDFQLIEEALALVVSHFQKETSPAVRRKAEELRQEFKDAHTGWLWFEEAEGK